MIPRLTSRLLLLLFMGGCLWPACVQEETRVLGRRLWAADQGGTAQDKGASCPAVGAAGCCAGSGTLRYCVGGQVVNQACQGGLQCGWNLTYGLYICGKSGGADPAGAHAWACSTTDAGLDGASPDAGSTVDLGGCGAVAYAGCCQGQVLHFCTGGKVLNLDCSGAPKCGWNASAGYYSCGTAGQADPNGQYPLACHLSADAGTGDVGAGPDGPAPDSQAWDLAGSGPDGPLLDKGWTQEGFAITPDTIPHGDVGLVPDLSPAEQGPGLDFTGFEGGASDLGGSAPDVDDQGCSCSTSSAQDETSTPAVLALTLALALLFRRRPRGATLVLALALTGCSSQEPAGQTRLPLSAGDLTSLDGPADSGGGPVCGAITSTGCCDGETLWWCQEGRRHHKSCRARPRCGWSAAARYDCDTSGAADPSGKQLQQCRALLGDGGLPASDGATTDGGPGCGAVSTEGCCVGQTLVYCQKKSGRLKTISCALNLSCGWHPGGQLYDCGTLGQADPAGKHPRSCPSPLPGDLSLDGPLVPDGAVADQSIAELGGDAEQAAPGGCSVTRGRGSGALLLLLLLAMLAYPAASRRRWT